MPRVLVLPFAIAVLVIVGVLATQFAMIEAGPRTDIDAESWTPNAGNVTTLDHSDIDGAFYDQTVVVRDADGQTVVGGVDYTWYENNGTIETIPGGELDGDNNAEIDYGYSVPSEEHKRYRDVMVQYSGALGAMLPLFGLLFLLVILRGG